MNIQVEDYLIPELAVKVIFLGQLLELFLSKTLPLFIPLPKMIKYIRKKIESVYITINNEKVHIYALCA